MNTGRLERTLASDPTTTLWLKQQLSNSSQRDPIDALNDAESLVSVLRERVEMLMRAHDVEITLNADTSSHWYRKSKYRYEHGGIVFEWNRAEELGVMVAESESDMGNPFDPSTVEYDDFVNGYTNKRLEMNGKRVEVEK